MSLLTLKKNVATANELEVVETGPLFLPESFGKNKIPSLLIGLGCKTRPISKSEDERALARFERFPCCEACGVSLLPHFRKSMRIGDEVYNACRMCYFPVALEEIDCLSRGTLVHCPHFSQQMFNAMVRAVWCAQAMLAIDKGNYELQSLHDSLDEFVDNLMRVQKIAKAWGVYYKVDDLANTLFVIKDDLYQQRYKQLFNFRWFPPIEMFREEIMHWTMNDYQSLQPSNSSGFIEGFVAKYMKDFSVKR